MPTSKVRIVALLNLSLLMCSACSTQRVRPTPTKAIPVEVLKFIPVPETLTAPTPIPPRPGNLYSDVVAWIVTGWAPALQSCNADKLSIASLQQQE